MIKKCILITVCLLFSSLAVSQSFATEFKKVSLKSLSKSLDGVKFNVKSKKKINPASICKNDFLLSYNHQDFGDLVVFLYMAAALKNKIGIEFDETSIECNVEVTNIVLY